MPYKILLRLAKKSDKPEILKLLWKMHEEVSLGTLNKERAEAKVDEVLSKGCILVTEDVSTKKLVGTVGLLASSFWWTDQKALGDVWCFVSPKYRKSRAFAMLLKGIKTIAKGLKLPVLLANFGNVEESRKSKLYGRIGVKMGTTIIVDEERQLIRS